jgi:hypothetical protein
MRGGLGLSLHFERAIEAFTDARLKTEPVYVPNDVTSKELCWDFGDKGGIKFLEDCSKEELLYVAQVLCQKLKGEKSYRDHLDSLIDGMREQATAA